MAVAVEARGNEEQDLSALSQRELLESIYQNYQIKDELPEGVKIESPWGLLVIIAPDLHGSSIVGHFDDDLELEQPVPLLVVDARQVLIDIVKSQHRASLND